MDEISNRSLAVLLVVAIVVSVGGTFMSLSKLNQAPTTIYVGQGSPTGFITNPNGTTTVEITTNSELTFTISAVAFGSGWVNASATNCNVSTYKIEAGNFTYKECVGFNANQDPLVLENTGNTNFSVSLRSNASATQFIGGDATTPLFRWRVSPAYTEITTNSRTTTASTDSQDDSANSCGDAWRSQETWVAVNTSTTGGTGTRICGTAATYPFDSDNAQDEVHIDLFISIPSNAPSGARSADITATGTAAP